MYNEWMSPFKLRWQPYHRHLNFAAIKQLIVAIFNIGRFSFHIGHSLSNILEHGWIKIIAGYLIQHTLGVKVARLVRSWPWER